MTLSGFGWIGDRLLIPLLFVDLTCDEVIQERADDCNDAQSTQLIPRWLHRRCEYIGGQLKFQNHGTITRQPTTDPLIALASLAVARGSQAHTDQSTCGYRDSDTNNQCADNFCGDLHAMNGLD